MKEDLYGVLGLGRDATPNEIKAAHRRAVRETHPDAGGKKDAFHAVQRAYGILSDQRKREEYDRTGRVDETDPVARRRAQAMMLVASRISQIVADPRWDLSRIDAVGLAREQLDGARSGLEGRIEEARALQRRYLEFMRRLKRKEAPGVDNIRAMVDNQIQAMKMQVAALEDELQVLAAAQALLGEYVYEHDTPQTGWVHMGRPAAAFFTP